MDENSHIHPRNLLSSKISAEYIRSSEENIQVPLICSEINSRCNSDEFDAPLILGTKAQRYVEKVNETLKNRGLELKLIKVFEATLAQVGVHQMFQKISLYDPRKLLDKLKILPK